MTMNDLTIRHFIYPVPLAIVWMLMSNRIEMISFFIGYTLAFVIIWLLLSAVDVVPGFRLKNLPIRLILLIIYIIQLNWEIVLSGIDVFLRIVGVRPVRAGIVAVAVQDPEDNQVIAGLSAHNITITPGQLCVASDGEGKVMYIHCLDVATMASALEESQVKRVRILRRILGLD